MANGIYNNITGYLNRKSIRLQGYDYSLPGYYFVTICIHNRKQNLFGNIIDGKMIENDFGAIVRNELMKTEKMRPNIKIDTYVIMPNHVHVIIQIHENRTGTIRRGTLVGARCNVPLRAPTVERFGKPTSNSIPTIIRLIKSTITKQINVMRNSPSMPVWQRNYYEHIIRDNRSLCTIRKYIQDNPAHWDADHENHIDKEISDFKMSNIADAI